MCDLHSLFTLRVMRCDGAELSKSYVVANHEAQQPTDHASDGDVSHVSLMLRRSMRGKLMAGHAVDALAQLELSVSQIDCKCARVSECIQAENISRAFIDNHHFNGTNAATVRQFDEG